MPGRFSRTLNYSSVNEDWRTELAALRPNAGDRVLCVTGSGDRPLDLLAAESLTVVSIDRNEAQNHLLRLKIAAMRRLPFDEYTAFLGLVRASPGWRRATLGRIASDLSHDAEAYWKQRVAAVEAGVLYEGRFERYFRRIGRLMRLLRWTSVDELFSFHDIEAQRRFVQERWDTPVWRTVYRVVLCPLVSRLFLCDPAYYSHVSVPVGDTLYGRMHDALMRNLARDNFMVSLVLRGVLPVTDLPPYLTPAGYERIRPRLDSLEIVHADVVEYVRRADVGRFSGFSLSDVPSYLAEPDFQRLLTGVVERSEPGARVVIRQFLTRYRLPDDVEGRLERAPALERRLAVEDRSFGYEFIVAEVRDVAN